LVPTITTAARSNAGGHGRPNARLCQLLASAGFFFVARSAVIISGLILGAWTAGDVLIADDADFLRPKRRRFGGRREGRYSKGHRALLAAQSLASAFIRQGVNFPTVVALSPTRH